MPSVKMAGWRMPQDMKIIVWAHNSHVGDATATPMGGMDFQRNEPLVATWWEHVMDQCNLNVTYTADGGSHLYKSPLRMPRKWNLGQMLGLAEAFGGTSVAP